MALMVEAMERPKPFRRHGMGWRFCPPDSPVVLTFDRIVERRDEVTAELHVATRDGGYLARRRINLLGSRSLSDLARELEEADGGAGRPWKRIILEGCESTLEAHREGGTTETVEGVIQRPPPARWQCDGLVMAGVVNCWLGAAGTGKSTLAKAYCLYHAAGQAFLGRNTERGVPLYLDYEDSLDAAQEVWHDAARDLGLSGVPRMHWRKGRGSLKHQAPRLAQEIDRLKITLIVVDAVAAAGGPMTEHGGYEAVALDIEAALQALPPVTVLLLDHVTGEELKNGAAPIKARGATRKYEFIRNQWTMLLDRDEAAQQRHVVAWTHTKINRGTFRQPFGVEIIHRDGELSFSDREAVEVEALMETVSLRRRVALELTREAPLMPAELAERIYGSTSRGKVEGIRTTLRRGRDRSFLEDPDGAWRLVGLAKRDVLRPFPMQTTVQTDDPDDLAWVPADSADSLADNPADSPPWWSG